MSRGKLIGLLILLSLLILLIVMFRSCRNASVPDEENSYSSRPAVESVTQARLAVG